MSILTNHYVLAFIKFAILASLGEVIALSMRNKKFSIPIKIGYKMLFWGLLGVAIAFMMGVFAAASAVILQTPKSPSFTQQLAFAFLTSVTMNLSFGPTFMVFHKHTDTYLDLKHEGCQNITLKAICNRIDYYGYIKNVLFGTIPTFWVPAHTIVFMLPSEFRIIVAAALSIALGILLELKSN